MICSSCGRTVEDGMPFCPHCGSAVIQPFMTEEDKEREDAEVEAALRSLDQIKHTAAKPLSEPLEQTAPIGVAAVQPNYTSRRTDGRIVPLIIGLDGALALAIGLFIMVPKIVNDHLVNKNVVTEYTMMTPSTGMFSPGFTAKTSPTLTSSTGTILSSSPTMPTITRATRSTRRRTATSSPTAIPAPTPWMKSVP